MLSTGEQALLPVYAQMPVRPVSGHGAWLVDEDGSEWLDAYGGHAVASTGHCHPRVVEAITAQAAKLVFYSTAVPYPLRPQLAAELAARCPGDLGRVFFCNSGAEANENALHLARKATGRSGVASVTGGWHGRTVATLACCDGASYEAGALRAGMALSSRVTFDDISSLDAVLDETMAALIVEPIQGMAGARDCSIEFLAAARRLCTDRGIALLFDEVQCGVGRSGTFTAAEGYGIVPDGLTMAKGLGSGYPIGALVAGPHAGRWGGSRRPGQHLWRRTARLRRGAGHARGDRRRRPDWQRCTRRRARSPPVLARSAHARCGAVGCSSGSTSTARRKNFSRRFSPVAS